MGIEPPGATITPPGQGVRYVMPEDGARMKHVRRNCWFASKTDVSPSWLSRQSEQEIIAVLSDRNCTHKEQGHLSGKLLEGPCGIPNGSIRGRSQIKQCLHALDPQVVVGPVVLPHAVRKQNEQGVCRLHQTIDSRVNVFSSRLDLRSDLVCFLMQKSHSPEDQIVEVDETGGFW